VPGAASWGRGEKTGPRRKLSQIITFITSLERRIIVQVNIMIMVVCGAFVVKRARAQDSHRVTDQKRSKGLTRWFRKVQLNGLSGLRDSTPLRETIVPAARREPRTGAVNICD
jgi:hypothetical protein